MARNGRRDDPRTISHGLPDDLTTTLGERLAAQREVERRRSPPPATEKPAEVADSDAPTAPGGAVEREP
jgi:hypothetical protein